MNENARRKRLRQTVISGDGARRSRRVGRGLDYFEQSFERSRALLLWFGTDPMLESLHDDARYPAIGTDNHPSKHSNAKQSEKNQPNFAVLPFKLLHREHGRRFGRPIWLHRFD